MKVKRELNLETVIVIVLCVFIGMVWLFYDITVPTFSPKVVNQTPAEVFGPYGTIKGTSPEILGRKFWYRVDIINLKLSWKEYKKAHGENEYVHAYASGGVTILTDDPGRVWEHIDGDKRWWIRKINWPIQK